jgi:ATP-dependent Clp protease ATP-binding subunit ClpC
MESPNVPYNQQASRVFELAKEEAQNFNHNFIGPEHLLLGILSEGSTATELTNLGVTVERMRGGIMFIIGRPQGTPASPPDFAPCMQKVLSLAGEEAQRVGEPAISPHHLLIAILRARSFCARWSGGPSIGVN